MEKSESRCLTPVSIIVRDASAFFRVFRVDTEPVRLPSYVLRNLPIFSVKCVML